MTTRNPLPTILAALFLLLLVGLVLVGAASAAAAATGPGRRRPCACAASCCWRASTTAARRARSCATRPPTRARWGACCRRWAASRPRTSCFVSTANRAAFDAAFADIEQRLRAGTTPGVRRELLVYYSGHSDEDGLMVGRDRVGYDELRARVQKRARRAARRDPGFVRVGRVHAPQGRREAGAVPDGRVDRHARPRVPDLQRRRRARAGVRPHRRLVLHLLPGVRAARRRRRQPGQARHAAGGVSVRVAGDAGAHGALAGRAAARRLRVRPRRHRRHGRHRRARHAVGPGADARAGRPHHRARGERRAGRRAAQAGRQHHRARARAGRLRRGDGQRQHDLPGQHRADRRQAHARWPRRPSTPTGPREATVARGDDPPAPAGAPDATATGAARAAGARVRADAVQGDPVPARRRRPRRRARLLARPRRRPLAPRARLPARASAGRRPTRVWSRLQMAAGANLVQGQLRGRADGGGRKHPARHRPRLADGRAAATSSTAATSACRWPAASTPSART